MVLLVVVVIVIVVLVVVRHNTPSPYSALLGEPVIKSERPLSVVVVVVVVTGRNPPALSNHIGSTNFTCPVCIAEPSLPTSLFILQNRGTPNRHPPASSGGNVPLPEP